MITLIPIIAIGVFFMFREERKLTKKGKQIIRIERIKRLPTVEEYKVIAENVAKLANRINQQRQEHFIDAFAYSLHARLKVPSTSHNFTIDVSNSIKP